MRRLVFAIALLASCEQSTADKINNAQERLIIVNHRGLCFAVYAAGTWGAMEQVICESLDRRVNGPASSGYE